MPRENIWEGVEVNPPLAAARLRLEPVTPDHAGAMVRVLADPIVWRYTEEDPPTSAARLARDYAWLAEHRNVEGFMLNLQWVVVLREREEAVGYVGATVGTPWGRRIPARLAWMFAPDVWGRGIAYEAASEMIRFLREGIGVTFLRARIDARNDRSIRLAARLGLSEAARWDGAMEYKGAVVDELSYERDETPPREPQPGEP